MKGGLTSTIFFLNTWKLEVLRCLGWNYKKDEKWRKFFQEFLSAQVLKDDLDLNTCAFEQ